MQQFAAAEIGERIAQARRENDGMTQEQLAELLDVSTRAVQNYEAGVSIPWKHFSRLEKIFDRDLAWFLHGHDATAEAESDVARRLDDLLLEVRAIDRKLDLADVTGRIEQLSQLIGDLRVEVRASVVDRE